ncbi:MAG: ribose transport system permease protein [Alphaproteobacteria bacterium]|jgi:ribose/xylose/arabinose/galactoside ABC-type transport system permease subunit|nr:ribose transport system permease protein [Alphaproteobacteria bacterium]
MSRSTEAPLAERAIAADAREGMGARAGEPRNYVGIVRAIVLVVLAAVALTTPGFLSQPSILSLLTTVSFIGCVAVGMTLITISGNIMSFALGALVGATAMIFVLAVNWGGFAFGLIAALAFAGLSNALQGFLIGWLRANPIIVSIAALALIYGAAEAFAAHGTIYAAAGTSYGGFKGRIAGIPVEFAVFLCVAALGQFILSLTTFGRNLFLIGSSFRAAEAVGVRTWRAITGAYLWAGLFTAPAGIMLAIRYDAASMNYGMGYEYDAIAAVLVGGTIIKGGEGSVLRTLAGALIIGVIQVVLVLQGLRTEWQYLIAGLVVLGVIALQTSGTRD